MKKTVIARVAVDKTTFDFDKLYDYSVPLELINQIRPGCRVQVPFSRSNKRRQAMVLELLDADPRRLSSLKPVQLLLDSEPVLTPEQLKLAQIIKQDTFCTYFDAFRLMIPSGLSLSLTERFLIHPDYDRWESLSGFEREVFDYLKEKKNGVVLEKLLDVFDHPCLPERLSHLQKEGILLKKEETKRKIGDERVTMLELSDEYETAMKNTPVTPKQNQVIQLLSENGCASVKEVCYLTGVSRAVVDGLLKKGIVESYETEVFRKTYQKPAEMRRAEDIILTDEQQSAYDVLLQKLQGGMVSGALLFGITGSGKTSVFLKLINQVLESGRQVIVMVPEISLTPQTVESFLSLFGDQVAVLHSGLSLSERLDEWKRLKQGKATIAVGTRSAVFAPLDNIGLIVIDEEQEGSYKSERTPRFDAREIAKYRAVSHKSLVLLASATPSLESFYTAKSGKMELLRLNNRYAGAVLPEVFVVDTRTDRSNYPSLSHSLLEELSYNLQHKEQSILLLNRRGYNTALTCVNCGEVVSCPHCSVAMTYHTANSMLVCHYCSYQKELPKQCSHCGSEYIKYSGFGTQRVVEELQRAFPEARILRMDLDSTMTKFSHEKLLSHFGAGEYDILVGTQMIAKGLDFKNVTLVGVLSIDSALLSSDYKGAERTFSLLTQVVGRCGRGEKRGRAYIQTMSPDNPILKMAANCDYEAFYDNEIELRKMMLYPPFCDLLVVWFTGLYENEVRISSEEFLKQLKEKLLFSEFEGLPLRVLGPAAANIARVSSKYRYRMIIKCRLDKKTKQLFEILLSEAMRDPKNKNISISMAPNPEYIG